MKWSNFLYWVLTRTKFVIVVGTLIWPYIGFKNQPSGGGNALLSMPKANLAVWYFPCFLWCINISCRTCISNRISHACRRKLKHIFGMSGPQHDHMLGIFWDIMHYSLRLQRDHTFNFHMLEIFSLQFVSC